jgi:hypothetical protein
MVLLPPWTNDQALQLIQDKNGLEQHFSMARSGQKCSEPLLNPASMDHSA